MKQVLQSLKDGRTRVTDVPAPGIAPGHLLIRTSLSLVSPGTERMLVEFGQANWLNKARQQPDKVRMVLDKIRSDGFAAALDAVRGKLDQPLQPGYCNVGVVVGVGEGVAGFAVGDRVASNGSHAQVVSVPRNLCARIPDDVSEESAAFTVLAAIGLQGIRLAEPTLGECVAVIGLGVIGLLIVQMLRAQGCRVLGIDYDTERLALARQFGAEVVAAGPGEDVLAAAAAFSRGRGVDAAIIAAATGSNEPVSQAAKMCRRRGRIVLVGVTGLELSRADFYEKELRFQVSCSYGPGRYDAAYEQDGHDYPVGFVRWTEQRNFEAVLDLMASGALTVGALVSHRFSLHDAADAYALLAGHDKSLGIVLTYPADAATMPRLLAQHVALPAAEVPATRRTPAVAFIGTGNYAGRVLIPAFRRAGAILRTAVSRGGASAAHYARKFGFAGAGSDAAAAIADTNVDTVVVATRHATHAGQVLAALRAGKHVFCEKPLCLTLNELQAIETESAAPAEHAAGRTPLLMVGFNRRFAPHARRMHELLTRLREPKHFVMTVNAGAVAPEHWTRDPGIGGGRLVGEACHFVDLLRYLAAAPISGFDVAAVAAGDTATITLRFADGSLGVIHYLSNGSRRFPKERLEVFCAGRILRLDNFRRLRGWGWPGFRRMNRWRQDKGQNACVAAFVSAIRDGGPAPIARDDIFEVSRVAIEIQAQVG